MWNQNVNKVSVDKRNDACQAAQIKQIFSSHHRHKNSLRIMFKKMQLDTAYGSDVRKNIKFKWYSNSYSDELSFGQNACIFEQRRAHVLHWGVLGSSRRGPSFGATHDHLTLLSHNSLPRSAVTAVHFLGRRFSLLSQGPSAGVVVVVVVRNKVSQSYISRTVWLTITKFYRNLHTHRVYNK